MHGRCPEMPVIVVSPLSRIAEMAVRHRAREMISLMAKEQAFHRPAGTCCWG